MGIRWQGHKGGGYWGVIGYWGGACGGWRRWGEMGAASVLVSQTAELVQAHTVAARQRGIISKIIWNNFFPDIFWSNLILSYCQLQGARNANKNCKARSGDVFKKEWECPRRSQESQRGNPNVNARQYDKIPTAKALFHIKSRMEFFWTYGTGGLNSAKNTHYIKFIALSQGISPTFWIHH